MTTGTLLDLDRAVRDGDRATFDRLLRSLSPESLSSPIDRRGSLGDTVLHVLIRSNRSPDWATDLVALAPVLLNLPNQQKVFPLLASLADGVQDAQPWVDALLGWGASPLGANQRSETVVHWAAARQDGDRCLPSLLQHGAPINPLDVQGYTPLYHAVACRVPDAVIRVLIDAGADPREGRKSALDLAVERGMSECLNTLHEQVVRLEQAALRALDLPDLQPEPSSGRRRL